ncbi:MAG: TonB-dependent receptor [Methylicorpusculum sp.]|uniref:TonB-dependent receptor plug domain-containing protein n=1 Tax=Methylicorpusculum sp. TaxID=2713644 RepID=UPI00271E57E3|nr:TonB-dependent receptor [Methylicorpusculum sp.]MDO8940663.1 TonB-dependent receptor [Methylicorpusculum sp.]MDP2202708.1 TonB-dependent receptor [Methylicorpusculum sp.]
MYKTVILIFGLIGWMLASQAINAEEASDVYALDLEELLDVKVTSVSKKAQSLSDAPAAIFVISNEDIKRSGVTTIPDALRMAPGIDVARIDSNKWAVSSRGFNGRFANKLLVLIDGRNIYTPAFSGVYWEMQDVMMEDIDRIEVIRGPGAALWGANAVNGVINIITKHSADTQGGLVTGGGGTEELGFGSARYGTQLGEDTTGRVYMKGFKRDELISQDQSRSNDDWDKVQGGFRVDSLVTNADAFTVQGDAYHSNFNQKLNYPAFDTPNGIAFVNDKAQAHGANVVGRLQHTFSSTSSYTLQLFYDRYDREDIYIHEVRNTYDIDFQHRFALNGWNDIIWGGGYRYSESETRFDRTPAISFDPQNRGDQYFSAFLQDEISLVDNTLWLTLGSKFEHNDYTGFEYQPTARLMWTPHPSHKAWAAVSRAVRIPSRIDSDMTLRGSIIPAGQSPFPPFPVEATVNGSKSFDSEELLAYEVGYRFTFAKLFSLDVSAFFNEYESLRSFSPGQPVPPTVNTPYITQPFIIDNGNSGETYGVETSLVWQMRDNWRWDLSYSFIETHLHNSEYYQEAVSPQHKVSLRSSINPWKDISWDIWLRYTDDASAFTVVGVAPVESYITMDMRLGWRVHKDVELSLVGQNLLNDSQLEYIGENFVQPNENQRGFYGKLAWQF